MPAHGSLAGSIDGRDVADPSRVAVRRTDPRGGRWGTHLRAPPSWFEVLDSAPDRLPLLGDPTRPLLRKGYGTKVGIAAFFSPRRSESFDRLGVEPRFRRPFVRTLRDLHRYSFRGSDCTDELFVSDGPVDSSDAPGAAAWIAWGERQVTGDQVPWPEVPSVRGNRPWHALSGLRSGDVVLPQFRMSRHYAIANPDRIPINNSAWWGEWVDPDHREVGAALLNSTWVALAAEVVGRTNLGEGLLTCYGSDLDAIPLPDPARFVGTPAGRDLLVAWRDMKRRSVLPLADEVGLQDRRALDRAVMAGLGLDEGLAGQIQRDAVRLCDERVGLAASLREARRASAEARA